MKKIRIFIFLLFCCFFILLSSCLSPFSKAAIDQANLDISFKKLRESPDSYIGMTTLLGGDIIQVDNKQEGTLLKIIQKRLDRKGYPRYEDITGGRFMVFVNDFLDPAVYRKGRKVTVIGEIRSKEVEKIGEVDYIYPLLHSRELYLWKEPAKEIEYYPYPIWHHGGLFFHRPVP